MADQKKNGTPQHLRTRTEEERRQVAVTLTTVHFKIIKQIQERTGETRSQIMQRLIITEDARKEGQQEGNDEMRERIAELLAVG